MAEKEDPEERIRELERPLAETAQASEFNSARPAAPAYPPGPTGAPAPAPWTYGGPFPGPPPKRPSGNRMWWILGALTVIGVLAFAGGIAAFAAHQLSGVRSIVVPPPAISGGISSPANTPGSPGPSPSPAPPAGGKLSVSGINENRTIACNDSVVSVSGVSNTVVITGHCARLSVSGVQNSITVDAVDSIAASGFNNKVTYHSGTPKISNAGDSNVVQQG
ncbi:DUF3060 domain-containing protein [Mycobacterium sp.]|uniref:DUF3060 domain-containing protein n=1 Tax=Mycobacterium sp. TaxID=1785 RepID=UPI003C770BEE